MPGDIAGGEDPRVTCLSELIDKNAVVCSETRGLSKLSVRYRSNPHHDEVRLDCPIVCRHDGTGRLSGVDCAYKAVQL